MTVRQLIEELMAAADNIPGGAGQDTDVVIADLTQEHGNLYFDVLCAFDDCCICDEGNSGPVVKIPIGGEVS
jgi:hypothetical protein